VDADLAYLCGLLHNIGVAVLTHVAPQQMMEVFRSNDAQEQSLLQVELTELGISHDKAGLMLAQLWNLPDEVKVVIEHHREWSYRGQNWPVSSLVGFSKWVAEDVLAEEEHFLAAPIPNELGLEESAVAEVTQHCTNNVVDVLELAKVFSRSHRPSGEPTR